MYLLEMVCALYASGSLLLGIPGCIGGFMAWKSSPKGKTENFALVAAMLTCLLLWPVVIGYHLMRQNRGR